MRTTTPSRRSGFSPALTAHLSTAQPRNMDDGNWKTVRSHAEKQQKQAVRPCLITAMIDLRAQKKKAQKAEEKEEEDDGPIMIDAPRTRTLSLTVPLTQAAGVGSVTQWHAFEAHVEAKRKAAAENERRNKINREAQKVRAWTRQENPKNASRHRRARRRRQ